jgi:hypothetical protein
MGSAQHVMREQDVVDDSADLALLVLIETVEIGKRAANEPCLLRLVDQMRELMHLRLERPGHRLETRVAGIAPELVHDKDQRDDDAERCDDFRDAGCDCEIQGGSPPTRS